MLGEIFTERKRKICCACTERRICTRVQVIWEPSSWNPSGWTSDNEWVCDPCLEIHELRGEGFRRETCAQ